MIEMKNEKLIYWASLSIIVFAIVILGYLGYLTMFEGNDSITYNGPMQIDRIDYQTKQVTVLLDYCKKKVYPLTIYPAYINGIIYNLEPKESGGLKTGCNVVQVYFKIPDDLPNGVYKLQVRNEFRINPLKKITLTWETGQFTIGKDISGSLGEPSPAQYDRGYVETSTAPDPVEDQVVIADAPVERTYPVEYEPPEPPYVDRDVPKIE